MALLCLAVLGAVVFVLFDGRLTEGAEYWLLLLVLLCPLLHFVMHRSYGSSHGTQ